MGNTSNRPVRPPLSPLAAKATAPDTQGILVKARLTYSEYLRLEKQVGLPSLNSATSPIEAGYAMGVEKVLRLLRDGYVIDQQ